MKNFLFAHAYLGCVIYVIEKNALKRIDKSAGQGFPTTPIAFKGTI